VEALENALSPRNLPDTALDVVTGPFSQMVEGYAEGDEQKMIAGATGLTLQVTSFRPRNLPSVKLAPPPGAPVLVPATATATASASAATFPSVSVNLGSPGSIGSGLLMAKASSEAGGKPRGAQNPKVAKALSKGRKAHAERTYPEGFDKEVRLPSGKRMDAYNPKTKEVRELKPNNERAVRRGERQVDAYCAECDEALGPGHTGTVETYNPEDIK
jgi:hypothetical protein